MSHIRTVSRALVPTVTPLLVTLLLAFSACTVSPFSAAAQAQSSPPNPPQAAPEIKPSDDAKLPLEPEQAASVDDSAAQTTKLGRRSGSCEVYALGRCFKNLMHDQAGIWSSPAHIHSHDLLWIVPFTVATGAAIATDKRALGTLGHPTRFVTATRLSSNIGSPYAIGGISGAFYLIGSLSHHDKARETGALGLEALANTAIVVEVLKLATNRDRPDQGTGEGDFWSQGWRGYPYGTSFPSMHAAGSWTLARVIASEYPRPLVKILVYGLATGVSATRITGRKHFPSDVLVGSVTGYLIGGYVYRHHSSEAHEESAFMIMPFTDGATRSFGLTIAVKPEALQPHAIGKTFRNLSSFVRKTRD
jgi:membrane-associated phospholipid phosphatase